MVQTWWDKLPEKFPTVGTDAFVTMPNHIHGIIVITELETLGQTHGSAPTADVNVGPNVGANPRVCPNPKPTLGHVVQWFKTMTTNAYIRGVKQNGWEPFPGKFWQRNYYERIIRNERELNAIRQYIYDNPAQWESDKENPNRR